jgi:proliferating cell nuclear antigen PCNA
MSSNSKYVLYSKIIYIKEFKLITEVMCNVVPEATWRFIAPNPDKPTDFAGLEIATPNKNSVMYVRIMIDLHNIDCNYYCKYPTWDIEVDLSSLNKLLKMNHENDVLIIYQVEKDKRNLTLETTVSKYSKRFNNLKLMDPSRKKKKTISTDFTFEAVMPAKLFTSTCKHLGSLAPFLEIKCTSKSIRFTCKGDTTDNSYILKPSDEINGVKIYVNENLEGKEDEINIFQGLFDLSNLNLFSKFCNLNEKVKLRMKNDFPLIIEYNFAASSGKATIVLTPVNEDNIANCDYDYSEDEEDVKEMDGKCQNMITDSDIDSDIEYDSDIKNKKKKTKKISKKDIKKDKDKNKKKKKTNDSDSDSNSDFSDLDLDSDDSD